MSIGVERLVLAMEAAGIVAPPQPSPEFYLLALDDASLPAVASLALKARQAGTRVAFDCQPRSARAGLKAANRTSATAAIIVGSQELERGVGQWKNLDGGEQMELTLAEIEKNLTD